MFVESNYREVTTVMIVNKEDSNHTVAHHGSNAR